MVIYSFYRKGLELEPVEIEVTLLPGVPAFHVTGLPDTATKESVKRLKAALRHQGFELPTHQQVLFHLRPSHERKSSQGLDLALAAAFLWKTEQLPAPLVDDGRVFLYGELTLDGEVHMPDELNLLDSLGARDALITGPGDLSLGRGVVGCLRDLSEIRWLEGEFTAPEFAVEDQFDHFRLCLKAASYMTVAAAGEHNLFLAGPAGSGKTTFARALHSCLRAPTLSEWRRILRVEQVSSAPTSLVTDSNRRPHRPLVAPHHTASEIAILGGGASPCSGEITRAQHGMLLLDEFLNYESRVIESLREPIERHEITLVRRGVKSTYPADFLLVATTNLCPCGEFVPGAPNDCNRSLSHCRSYCERLSGPIVDRFDMVAFTHLWKTRSLDGKTVAEIREVARAAQKFALESRGQEIVNARVPLAAIEAMVPKFVRENLLPEMPSSSHRRWQALFRVARTVADLERSSEIRADHLDAAAKLALKPFADFRKAFR